MLEARDTISRYRLKAAAIVLGAVVLGATVAAEAPASPAEVAVRAALTSWMTSFNAGDLGAVCDLFSRDLRYNYRGLPERGYDDICAGLHRSLSDPDRHYAYSMDIKDILVRGDLAVVRVVWTLTVTRRGIAQTAVSTEISMDMFRDEPDGHWRIVRFVAYGE